MKKDSIKERKRLKIGQLNLEAGRGTTNNYLQYGYECLKNFIPINQRYVEAAGEFIGREGIDIMCLTEVDNGSFRSKNTNQVELISKISGLPFHTYFETYSVFKNVLGLGNAIVSNYPIIKSEEFRLEWGINPRVIGKVTVDIEGQEIDVYSTQLALGKETRHKQLDYLSKIINGEGRVILGADLNEQKEKRLKEITKKANMEIARTQPTYPSWNPTRTIDYIMTRGLKITDSRTHNNARFSDHLPITADVYFEK